jgi:hypothetical protein
VLGPVAVVVGGGIGRCEEGAVAAAFGFEQRDVRIGGDGCAGLVGEADEGIVGGVDEERGDGDAVENACGGGAEVVVVRGAEAGVEGGDAVVEVAERGDVRGALGVEGAGEEHDLAAEALEECAEEAALVEAVLRLVESVGGGGEIDGGRDADDGVELRRGAGAEIAGELEDEIAAHGVADERDGLKVLGGDEMAEDVFDVGGEAGVVERGGEACHVAGVTVAGVAAAAVAHVHADDVAAGAPELVGIADDVLRLRRAFEAVEDDRGWARGAGGEWLPVAFAEDLCGDLRGACGGDFDELPDCGWEVVGAGEEVAKDGLDMWVGEPRAGVKRRIACRPYGFGSGGAGCHLRASRLDAVLGIAFDLERRAVALRAPVGSSSCLK